MGAPPGAHDALKVTGQGRFHLQQSPSSSLLGSGMGFAILFGRERCPKELRQDGSPRSAPFSLFFSAGVFIKSNGHHTTRFLSVKLGSSRKSLIYDHMPECPVLWTGRMACFASARLSLWEKLRPLVGELHWKAFRGHLRWQAIEDRMIIKLTIFFNGRNVPDLSLAIDITPLFLYFSCSGPRHGKSARNLESRSGSG